MISLTAKMRVPVAYNASSIKYHFIPMYLNMYLEPCRPIPCSMGTKADRPNRKKATTLRVRQRSVLNFGIEIRATQAEPETMVWGKYQHVADRSEQNDSL